MHCSPTMVLLIAAAFCLVLILPTGCWATGNVSVEEATAYYSVEPGPRGRVKRVAQFRARRAPEPNGEGPHTYTEAEEKAVLDLHNKLRGKEGASNMLRMTWSSDLQKEAQRWADLCDFNHPTERRKIGKYDGIGQNLYIRSAYPEHTTDPVQAWFDEKEFYNFAVLLCTKPPCGHYTQVVWATAEELGCAIKWCNPVTSASRMTKAYLVVCEYGPAGNVRGQHPYEKGDACSKCPSEYKYCVDNMCSLTESAGDARLLHKLSVVSVAKTLGLVMAAMFIRRDLVL